MDPQDFRLEISIHLPVKVSDYEAKEKFNPHLYT